MTMEKTLPFHNGIYKSQVFLAILVLSVILLTAICTAQALPAQESAFKGQVQFHTNSYRLGPGDILSMQVLHEPEYSQEEALVRPDGHVSLFGIGDIDVTGYTVEQLTAEVTQRLSETLTEPSVNIAVRYTRPATIYLAGAVMHPGMVQLNTSSSERNFHVDNSNTQARTDLRLSNVLANAGGVGLNADISHVQVRCAYTGNSHEVNLWHVLKNGDASQDVVLHSGDSVFIPQLDHTAINDQDAQLLLQSFIGPKSIPVRVIGEVRNPGVYDLEGHSPLLSTALARAGGFAPQARKVEVAIRRFEADSRFTTFTVNPNQRDVQLRPNDVIYIGESGFYRTGRFMEQAARVLSPFTNAAAAGAGASQILGVGGWSNRP